MHRSVCSVYLSSDVFGKILNATISHHECLHQGISTRKPYECFMLKVILTDAYLHIWARLFKTNDVVS